MAEYPYLSPYNLSCMSIPLYFERSQSAVHDPLRVIAADLGGTKTNIAAFSFDGRTLTKLHHTKYHSKDYKTFSAVVNQFLNEFKIPVPDRICAGVAGPVLHEHVHLTNLNWDIDSAEVRQQVGCQEVRLINDLEATAYGLFSLKDEELDPLNRGNRNNTGNGAIIAPGTGLGEAGLFWDGHTFHPFPTEGGHCDFTVRSDLDWELHQYLHESHEVVSYEHVISGPGIHAIYTFLRDRKNRSEPAWLAEAMRHEDPSAVISETAIMEKCSLCMETMQMFVHYLARESGHLALKMKATGGLYLGGGIPPKIIPLLREDRFYKHFLHCDRMEDMLREIPIYVILNDETALLGAANYAAMGA